MQTRSVYDFNSPSEYLADFYQNKLKANPRFSLRAWAQQLGLRNHSLLSLVLKGQRNVSPKLAAKIIPELSLSLDAQTYFEGLVRLQNSTTEAERNYFKNTLDRLHPSHQFQQLKMDMITAFTDWRHLAILEMTRLDDFSEDAEWIAKRVAFATSSHQVKYILNRLIRVGVLVRKDGKLKPSFERTISSEDIPNESVKQLQKQLNSLGAEAMDTQNIEEREFFNYVFGVKKKDLVRAKKMLRKLREEFVFEVEETECPDEIYQFSMQLFKLTKKENPGEKK